MKTGVIYVLLVLLVSSSAAARVPEGDLLDGVRPGPDGKIDVLTVFAHQDDESIYGGGAMLLMMKDPRVRLHVLCLTLGQWLKESDKLGLSEEHYSLIRQQELKTAATVYGAEQVIQFRYNDRGLSSADQKKLMSEIHEVIEKTGAEIVITHDPVGFTGHPDHMTCSRATTEAFKRSSAAVLYYPTLPPSIYRLLWTANPDKNEVEPSRPTMRVDIRSVKKLKKLACYAHASQLNFTSVGPAADAMLRFDHEYFTLAASNK